MYESNGPSKISLAVAVLSMWVAQLNALQVHKQVLYDALARQGNKVG